ncbi:MAG: hypothetical protein KatS3mg126_1902 [Lysobacteraceae bacterium]|nr:MAG: hypothetical protein KatS3mg126_1902 [Xanthomonadaceae bacterium]
MNDPIKEQLSALMDGELRADQAGFLHRRLQGDPQLRAEWGRWHLVRDVLQRRAFCAAPSGLVERVAASIGKEAVPRRGLAPGLLRWGLGAAVAASVAVFALGLLPDPMREAGPAPDGLVQAVRVPESGLRDRDLRPALGPVAQPVAATAGLPAVPAVQVDPRVDGWLLRHNAAALTPLHQSFVPYIPVVSPYRPQHGQVILDSGSASP